MRQIVAVAVLLSFTQWTRGETVDFDFSSGIGPYFSVSNDSGLFNVTTEGSGVRISKAADNGTIAPTSFVGAGIRSNFSVVGDFSVTVDFTLTDFPFPFPNQVEGQNESILSVIANPQSYVDVLRDARGEYGGENLIEGWAVPPSSVYGCQGSSLTSGRYRLQRSGSIITQSFTYAGSSSFTLLGSADGFFDPMSIQLVAAQGDNSPGYARSTTSMDVSFDNLIVQADQIQGIPEPSALVLLGMGAISLFAYAWRRRRQAA